MDKSWKMLGFNPDDGANPFPPKRHERDKPKPARPEAPRKKKPVLEQKARRKATSTGRKRSSR